MVKIAKRAAQDPCDSSLQMKVSLQSFRLDNILFSVEETPLQLILTQLSLPLESSLRTQSLLNPSSGII